MKNIIAALILLGAPAIASAREDLSGNKVIYGTDDRLDYYQASPAMRKLADSVVSLWKGPHVTAAEDGRSYLLATKNYGTAMRLCPEEPFREQPIGAFCSGSLVGANLIMTAGHCIQNETDCANTRFVFGFGLKAAGDQPSSARASDVYSCKSIVKRYLGADSGALGPDYALVELDRPAEGRAPLAINRGAAPETGDALFVIGHPIGLPVKVADGATVRDPAPAGYFVANLDTYGGNSGSAVFNAKTKLIEGILVRGENDFIDKNGCQVSYVVPMDGGRGEDVTRISELASVIPETSDGTAIAPMPAPESPALPEPGKLQAMLKALGTNQREQPQLRR